MPGHKNIIVKFKKAASSEEKSKLLDEFRGNGAQIKDTDHIDSKIMPFVALSLPEQHFDEIRSQAAGGDHAIVEYVEEDGEVHTM